MSALGTEYKINVHMKPIDGLSMDKYDYFKTISRSVRENMMGDYECFRNGI
jgi:hypothetical protein